MKVTLAQQRWLASKADEHFGGNVSSAVQALIVHCNQHESKETKSTIFRQVRCHNCSQASTGGTKVSVDLDLPAEHVEWLDNVARTCGHPDREKTLRIMLDWYIATRIDFE